MNLGGELTVRHSALLAWIMMLIHAATTSDDS